MGDGFGLVWSFSFCGFEVLFSLGGPCGLFFTKRRNLLIKPKITAPSRILKDVGIKRRGDTCIHVGPLGRACTDRVHTSGDATPTWEDVRIRANMCSVVLNLILVYLYAGIKEKVGVLEAWPAVIGGPVKINLRGASVWR